MSESLVMLWGNHRLFQLQGLGSFSGDSAGEGLEIVKRQLLSVSRYYQNPLCEMLSLWSSKVEDNKLLDYALHPLQGFVSK